MKKEDFKDISNSVFLESVNKIIEQKGLCDGINCGFKEDICPFHHINSKNNNSCSDNQYKSYDKESLLNSAIEFKKMLENENKSFEEIQEKTKEIIKSNDEKLKKIPFKVGTGHFFIVDDKPQEHFELKVGMEFIDEEGIKQKVLNIGNSSTGETTYIFEYDKFGGSTAYFSEGVDWEETRKLNEVKEKPKQEKYIIWNPKGCNPKKIHETLKSAEQEAERLALSQPNEDFYVLEVVKKVRGSVSIVWE